MPAEVWGTCSVNDHLRPEAFLRELLMFDRVVVPYPADDQERRRWRRPNPANPKESWSPGRLDNLLEILGTEDRRGHGDVPLAFTAPWSEKHWQAGKQLAEVAAVINELDVFSGTRAVLRMNHDLPGIVEAVPAYPSHRAWWEEARPLPEPKGRVTAATALVALARPLLLPDPEGRPPRFRLLEVVELACDPHYRKARSAYHEWLRDAVRRLAAADADLAETVLDPASMKLLTERLDQAVADELRIVKQGDRRRRWTKGEVGMTVIAAAGKVGDTLASPGSTAAKVVTEVLQLAGWAAGKKAAPPDDRPLTQASMFTQARRRIPPAAPARRGLPRGRRR